MKAPTPLEALLKDRVALAVGAELRAVEEAIAAQIASPVPLVQEMGEFIAGAGGKRLRPILLLMAARLAGYVGPRAVRMGCVVELLHFERDTAAAQIINRAERIGGHQRMTKKR